MDSSIIPLHIFHYIKTFLCLLLIISNISHFTFAAIALNGRINARPYDGFQFLEPALIPTGNYISLSGIMPSIVSNSTSSLPNSPAQDELITTILNVLDGLLTSPASSSKPISARRRRRRRAAGIIPSSSSGIRPLTTIRIPMGIFISDQSSDVQHDALLQQPGASKARLTSGLSRVIQRLRQSADSGGRQRGTFNYARTFNGLAPVEPVYIPRGYFIPLTPLLSGKQELPPTEASRPFAGIQPLTLTQLAGGIFIPHRMPALPNDIPSQIVPPESKPGTNISQPSWPSTQTDAPIILPPPKPINSGETQTTIPPEVPATATPLITTVVTTPTNVPISSLITSPTTTVMVTNATSTVVQTSPSAVTLLTDSTTISTTVTTSTVTAGTTPVATVTSATSIVTTATPTVPTTSSNSSTMASLPPVFNGPPTPPPSIVAKPPSNGLPADVLF